MYSIIIQQEAIIAITNACNWYDEQREGLGDELMFEINKCLEKLSEHPENYTFININYRRIKTNRFPYLLIYEVEDDVIIVNSIRHAKRKK